MGRNQNYLEALAMVLQETMHIPCKWEVLDEEDWKNQVMGPKSRLFVLDLANFPANAGEAIAIIKEHNPKAMVVCIHHLRSDAVANKVHAWGADAYIVKTSIITDLEKFIGYSGMSGFFSSDSLSMERVGN